MCVGRGVIGCDVGTHWALSLSFGRASRKEEWLHLSTLKHGILRIWYIFRTHAVPHVAVYNNCGLTRVGFRKLREFGNCLETEVERGERGRVLVLLRFSREDFVRSSLYQRQTLFS